MTKDLRASARLFDVANTDDEVIDVLERLRDTLKRSHQARAGAVMISDSTGTRASGWPGWWNASGTP